MAARTRLAQERDRLGYSQESLAERLRVDPGTVGRWERGEVSPRARNRRSLAEALGRSLRDLDGLLAPIDEGPLLWVDGEVMPVRRRDFLRGALSSGAAVAGAALAAHAAGATGMLRASATRPDGSTAEYLSGLVQGLRHEDDVAPTGSLLTASARLLSLAEQFTADARSPDQRPIGQVAAEAAMLHWWLTVDTGRPARAEHDHAMSLAIEWEVPALVGHLLGWRSGLALAEGDLATAVRLARRAREPEWQMSPGALAWSAAYESRAHLLAGAEDPMRRSLDEAQAAYAEVDPEREPPWLYWLSGPVLTLEGLDMRLLREGPDAAPDVEAALAALPPERARDEAWYRAHLAAAHARAGDDEGAAVDAERAARLSAATGTTWTLAELHQLSREPHLTCLSEVLADTVTG